MLGLFPLRRTRMTKKTQNLNFVLEKYLSFFRDTVDSDALVLLQAITNAMLTTVK